MDPKYESLGDEQFQRFCQSLLTYEEPDLQALEIGQPDGGRDAFTRKIGLAEGTDYSIFQVKFVRSPRPLKDPEKWIEKALADEMEKIERLVERGATSYRLITNAIGSAHHEAGAVDKVAAYLAATLPIPADCWWRNDLNVRLAKHPELRWGYPELLSPTDVLKELVGSQMGEDAARRTAAIQAFLTAQYTSDRTVRFRQVELQTPLLDVFVDVPAAVQVGRSARTRKAEGLVMRLSPDKTRRRAGSDRPAVGAAELLFHHEAGEIVPRLVLEGAPGQGKSTLTQYLCQVHRMRLLRRGIDLTRIPESHQSGPARLPFRVELRDFAAFLQGHDPFENDPEWGGMAPNQIRSLEGFLTCLVLRHSGGAPFTVSDLHAVISASHLFIAFDGLDEVAEFKDRRIVIDAIKVGTERIDNLALGLQTLVTSRPAAFTHSPGFSTTEVPHLHLVSMPRKLIANYATKWSRSRSLDSRESRGIQRVLTSQLDQPHIRDLARNPMQLAILLTLILTKGESLPDKRTDLYTSYLDIFFNREAAKSNVVRENRDTLIALHQYLAWKLHSAAESDSAGGSISRSDLEAEVSAYLRREGKDIDLADHLFKGMVERVLALVSRVQGRFEFEVQPLREYFAASHLYATATVSQLGQVSRGTILDRFDGLARNPYWLNVVRFYAGFYNSGQLPSLVTRLKAMGDDPDWSLTDRPRTLAAMLLGDWSFSLERQSRDAAIDLALDGIGVRHTFAASGRGLFDPGVISLPFGAGQEELVDRAWKLLDDQSLPADRRSATEMLLAIQADSSFGRWLERVETSFGPERSKWIDTGWWTGILRGLPDRYQSVMWSDNETGEFARRASRAVSSGLAGVVESDDEKSLLLLHALLEGEAACSFDLDTPSWFGAFGSLLRPSTIYEDDFYRVLRRWTAGPSSRRLGQLSPTARLVAQVVRRFSRRFDGSTAPHTVLREFFQVTEGELGSGWGLSRGAIELISSQKRPSRAGRAVELFDSDVPVVDRIRYARSKGGRSNGEWWRDQIGQVSSTEDMLVALTIGFSWPTNEALNEVIDPLGRMLGKLEQSQFRAVGEQVAHIGWLRGRGRTPEMSPDESLAIPLRVSLLLARRDPGRFGKRLFGERLATYRGKDPEVLRYCLESGTDRLAKGEQVNLSLIRRAYREIQGDLDDARLVRFGPNRMPLEVAETIVRDAAAYPLSALRAAEERCAAHSISKLPPLSEVAEEEGWFGG